MRGNDNAIRTRSDDAIERILGVDSEGVIASLERVSTVRSGALETVVRSALARHGSAAVGHNDLGPVLGGDGSIVHGHGMASRVGCEGRGGGGSEAVIVLHVMGSILADGATAFVAHGSTDFLAIVALLALMMVSGGGVVVFAGMVRSMVV